MSIEGRGDAVGGRLRLGMVGGGQGAFIGAVHRMAARLDDRWVLAAGALSSDPVRARASALELGIAEDRAYASYQDMLAAEAGRADRIDAVAIVTPNHMHYPVARAALEAGFDVICDKPLTATVAEAEALADLVATSGRLFAVTYNYTGYPLIRQARAMVAAGAIGDIRVVQVEYPQAWLTEPIEQGGQKQADWRTDPARSGAGGCVGDIGTHAYDLARFVSGLEAEAILAELTTFVPGRRLDDNVGVLIRYRGGARGMLWASQVAPGNENGLRLRVYGSRGGLEWSQEDPNYLWFTPLGEPKRRITRGGDGASPEAGRLTRVPFGHPEGYIEGFANIYREIADALAARKSGGAVDPAVVFPDVADGLAGVRFVAAAVKSASAGGTWVPLA
ncbi:Gfo/Idh/MocA family protein [Prosthecodimorpha staleyi]|uniref:Gfo/Idh/MocA family oxidoreductase n=1 Tax=Prosthecodimorpha staleyi TaxID=2840188 RepID=A0A947GDD0_9HYPH|nr:Gfo/Idh/MocA family oxidoreductase [Prosthecodimorpha staleyi]MBT9292413.1 Gfo/Idh/MocA family oxidoreductase [Prosthecodimorpha staleyi]